MNDDSRTIAATLAGAVIGGIVGYLFFTERGREVRRQVEPALDDIARELNSFRHTLRKAAGVAGEGWQRHGGRSSPFNSGAGKVWTADRGLTIGIRGRPQSLFPTPTCCRMLQ